MTFTMMVTEGMIIIDADSSNGREGVGYVQQYLPKITGILYFLYFCTFGSRIYKTIISTKVQVINFCIFIFPKRQVICVFFYNKT